MPGIEQELELLRVQQRDIEERIAQLVGAKGAVFDFLKIQEAEGAVINPQRDAALIVRWESYNGRDPK